MYFSEKATAFFSSTKKIINIRVPQVSAESLRQIRKKRCICKQKNTFLFKPKIDSANESKQINHCPAGASKAQRKNTQNKTDIR